MIGFVEDRLMKRISFRFYKLATNGNSVQIHMQYKKIRSQNYLRKCSYTFCESVANMIVMYIVLTYGLTIDHAVIESYYEC